MAAWYWDTYVLHHTNSLLGLANELILGLFNLLTGILAQVVQVTTGSSLLASLDRVQGKTGVLNILACLSSEHEVGVESSVPASQKTGLNLRVLSQTGLADLLLGQSVLLQRVSQRVLTLDALRKSLGSGERSAGDGVVEGLGLGLSGGGSSQSCLGLGGGAGLREKVDLLVDGAAQVVEGLADVGRVVIGLVGVLGAVTWGSIIPASVSGFFSYATNGYYALTSLAGVSGGPA